MKIIKSLVLNSNIWFLLPKFLALRIGIGYVFHALADFLNIKNNGISDLTVLETVFAIVIITPLLETLVFQFGIQEIALKVFKNFKHKLWIAILLSCILFSLTHYYSLFYIIMTLVSGFMYSAFYILVRERTDKIGIAFMLTFFLHMGYNLFEFLKSYTF